MKEILRKYRRWFCLLKLKPRLLIIIVSIFGFLVILSLLFIKYWFVLAPFGLRSKLALDKLALSCYQEPVCHEDCFLERERYRQLIVASWQDDRFQKIAVERMTNEAENECLRLELAGLWRQQYTPQQWPESLINYLSDPAGDLVGQMKLGQKLGFSGSDLSNKLLAFISDYSNESKERYQALLVLANNPDPQWIDFYFQLFIQDQDLKIREEAIIALSAIKDDGLLTIDRLNQLLGFLRQESNDIYLKKAVVFFLTDYITDNRVKTGLEQVFRDDKVVDRFTRTFLADALNIADNLRPVISAEEWQEYSQNSITAKSF